MNDNLSTIIREVDKIKDIKHLQRIWQEVGWIDSSEFKYMADFIKNSDGLVAEINGQPECYVTSIQGDFKYQENLLPFSCISGVTTSLIARKQQFAGKTTAQKIAKDAINGAVICGLGMFEQGFYNQLGFGNGTYEYFIHFTPASLKIKTPFRVPERLTKKDLKDIQWSRENRFRKHGSCNLPKVTTKFEISSSSKRFGLGYRDKNGKLTHHVWLYGYGSENGPMSVIWMAYQNYDQFLELMALLKSLGDQIMLIRMIEPPGIYIQDLLDKPFYHRELSKDSKYMNQNKSFTFWQLRILDIYQCIKVTELPINDFSFNLKLSDPISTFLDKNSNWNGISGDYIITLGLKSLCVKGNNPKLDTLETSVNGFTRMWAGILLASSLQLSEKFIANENLIKKLDVAFSSLPKPHPDWDF
jgi:predicted acetyltransferase